MTGQKMDFKTSARRGLAILLALVTALSLAACGGGGKEPSGEKQPASSVPSSGPSMPEITIRDGVVRSQDAKVDSADFNADGFNALAVEDGKIYGIVYSYEEDGDGAEFVNFGMDGSGYVSKKYKTPTIEESVIAAAFYNGNYYLGVGLYTNSPALDFMDENAGDEEIPEDMSEDASVTYEIRCVGTDGKEKWSKKIEAEDPEYYYINTMSATEEGIAVTSSEGADLYSFKDGSFIKKLCNVKSEELNGVLYVLGDGTVTMVDDTSLNNKICVFDESSGSFQEKMVLPAGLQGSSFFTGSKYNFYAAGTDGIYATNLSDGKIVPLVNFVNSDMDVQAVLKLLEVEDGRILIQSYGGDNTLTVSLLEPVAPEDVVERRELTLGGYYIDPEVRTEIINFNKESGEFRISILDYSQYDLETDEENYENLNDSTGLSRLNTDIVTGKAPDIMLLQPGMPVSSFMTKGVLMDLTDYYDKDSGIDKSDFLQNVIDAFKSGGKMYSVVPGFTVTGVSGKAKYIGDGKDLTIKKVTEAAAARGIKPNQVFGVTSRAEVFQSAIEFSGDEFIDREDNTCDFNKDEFRELLEFCKDYPEKVSEEQYNDYFTQYTQDRAILAIQYLNTVYDYFFMTRQLFGDTNVTVTGFPSADNKGPAIASALQIGISSSASDPEGCWSFVRRFLLPDFQMAYESSLPISLKAIEAQGQKIIEQNKKEMEENQEMEGLDPLDGFGELDSDELLTGVDPSEKESDADSTSAAAAVEESEDLTGQIIVDEENFDGTHEEYLQYLEDAEAEAASASSAELAEAVVLSGDEVSEEAISMDNPFDEQYMFNEKDIEAVKNILKDLHFQINAESDVLKIITEEAAAYFAGQKSAEEVSEIIQSRVQVYLKENE